jgi:hypothetical protein
MNPQFNDFISMIHEYNKNTKIIKSMYKDLLKDIQEYAVSTDQLIWNVVLPDDRNREKFRSLINVSHINIKIYITKIAITIDDMQIALQEKMEFSESFKYVEIRKLKFLADKIMHLIRLLNSDESMDSYTGPRIFDPNERVRE